MSIQKVLTSIFLSSLLSAILSVSSTADTISEKVPVPSECEWDCNGWWFPSIDEIFSRSVLVHPTINYQSSVSFKENSKSYTISVILPDINKKDISINVINNVLVIAAERKISEKTKDTTQQLYSSYHQNIVLPQNANIDKIDAKYKKGSVTITIPKTRKKATKKIHIR